MLNGVDALVFMKVACVTSTTVPGPQNSQYSTPDSGCQESVTWPSPATAVRPPGGGDADSPWFQQPPTRAAQAIATSADRIRIGLRNIVVPGAYGALC